jgi:hypothetical protein
VTPKKLIDSEARALAYLHAIPLAQARRQVKRELDSRPQSMAPWYERIARPYERTETVR